MYDTVQSAIRTVYLLNQVPKRLIITNVHGIILHRCTRRLHRCDIFTNLALAAKLPVARLNLGQNSGYDGLNIGFGFLGIVTVAGVLLWSLVLIAGPGDYTVLAWIAGYLYLRLGLSAGLVFGGYAVAGWRFAWARHSGEEPDEQIATFSTLTILAIFSALGAFIATRFV